ncbi:hypothetical protein JOQ06_005149 [Pogonophryne albipinna]|uniref:Uncharacterized protein n=1 Tax=Pogonophryne albipinna TaxID=1090488 RepID=A0AAD6F4D3_9TELE|nr:hypothetical protein JOQ06_005149 [Pogonophryne albipinna]
MPFHHVTAGLLYKGNYLSRSLSDSDSDVLASISVEELDEAVFMNPLFSNLSESNHLNPQNTNLINYSLQESAGVSRLTGGKQTPPSKI